MKKSILNKDDNIMNSHPNEFQTNSRRYYQLYRIITFEPERIGRGKENNCKRDKTQYNFHSFEYLLS